MTSPFYDNADWRNLPHGANVMLYFDGEFAAPFPPPSYFLRSRYITVKADYRHCGAVDLLEQPWYTRAMLRAYVRGRLAMGKMARIYTDRAQAAEAVAALKDDGTGDLLSDMRVVFWIATLDGIEHTPAQLAADLGASWGAPEITAGRIWAEQWRPGFGGASDTSALFLAW